MIDLIPAKPLKDTLTHYYKALGVVDPPNANLALDQFVVPDPTDPAGFAFDTAAWGQAAWGQAAWGQAAWGQAAWGQAAWGQAAWGQTYWSAAAWGQSTDGIPMPVSGAENDVSPYGGYWIGAADLADAKVLLGLG